MKWQLGVHEWVVMTGLEVSGSAGDKPARASNMSRSAENKLGSPADKAEDMWKHKRQVSEPLELLSSGLGQTTSSLGMLLVHVQTIDSTYHPMIF